MGSRGHSSLSLLPVLLLLLEVNCINSFQQEKEDLTDQTKGESHRPLRRSKRKWVITTLELEEEDQGPFPKFIGELFNDMSQNTSLLYFITGPGVDTHPEVGLFSIEDHRNGRVYVHRPVDREATPSFTVFFNVVDRFTRKVVDNSLIFNIRISDVNDHAPQFPEKEFNISVKENHAAGQPIFQMLTVDLDEENTPNSQVLYFLVSQTPSLKDSGFQIDHISGEIRLSGCLDYETARQFKLLVGAKDLGEPPLTSTATAHVDVQDGNNHRPTFTQESYRIQISEGRTSHNVLRLPVQDGDLPFTSAWRVKFHILTGNEEGHFDILTDPETNEGILNVIKPLDYETHPARGLVIAVENEELLFLCEGGRVQGPRGAAASATVSLQVMDANDPPAFHPRSFVVSEVDGAGPGIQLGVFNATDPDRAAGPIRYKLAYDPANWVSVDELSGTVITTQQIDRESPYVNDSFYIIIVQAVDDGLPPQTGTGTLMLFLSDVNDNAPALRPLSRYVEVCESALNETLILQAEDADLEPYADPFTFELDHSWERAGDTWKLGENWGRSVELMMLRSLPPGNYSVPLFIGDKQGLSQKQTVHVRVCACPGGVVCMEPSVAVTGAGLLLGGLAPLWAALMILAATLPFLLRPYLVSGVRPRGSEHGQQTLITCNDESKAISIQGRPDVRDQVPVLELSTTEAGARLGAKDLQDMLPPAARVLDHEYFVSGTPAHYRSSLPVAGYDMCFEPRGVRKKYSTLVYQDPVVRRGCLDIMAGMVAETLSQKLCVLDPLAGDTGDRPRIYAEEGECDRAESLSSLTFSEPDQDPWASKAAPPEEIQSESGVPS